MLSEKLSVDAGGFNQGMQEATQQVEQFGDATKKASDDVKELGKTGSKSAKDLIKEMSNFAGAERSVNNYRQKLGQMTRDIQDLTINYNAMSKEMQNSQLGQETLAKIQELTLKAGQYKDAIMDAQQAIKAVASDTAAWDGMKMGIDVVSSSLQAFVSTGVLGKKSTEDLVKVIAKLKAIEAATNAVIKVGNALQKQSALMMGVAKVQALALAKAKVAETAATKGATIAQKAFNIVANANPYVLLATAVITVVGALAAFATKNKEAEEAEKRAQEAAEKHKEEMEEFATTVGGAAGKTMAKFNQLKDAYNKLSGSMDKTQFLKDNQKAFEELGISITNLGDADNVFINNTAAFEKAVMERARAAALYNLIVKNFEAYATEIERINKAEAPFKAGQIIDENRMGMLGHKNDYWTMGTSDRHMGAAYVQLNESGAELLNEEWRQRQRDAAEKALTGANSDLQRQINEANSAFNTILSKYGIKASGGSGTGKGGQSGIEAQVGSLAAAQAKVSELQTVLNNMSPDNAAFEETKQKLAEAKGEVERIQKLLQDVKPDPGFTGIAGSLDEANYYVNTLTKELNGLDPNSDKFKEVLALLNEWKEKQTEINNLIKGTETETETVLKKYDKIVSKAGEISKQFKLGLIDQTNAQAQIDELNKQLAAMGIKVKVQLDIDEKSIQTTAEKINSFVKTMDKVGSLSNGVTAINSVYESISGLSDKLEEAKNGWEVFFAIFQTGMTIFNAVATIIETVATVTELLTAAKTALSTATTTETAAEVANTTATAANTAAAATNTGAKITEAAATGALAASEGASSVASIPFVGPALAIAAIVAILAAVIGAIASAKGFAEGGIVGGHSYTGDKIIARLNSNEMVLTTKQQERLWGMMNAGSEARPQVEFKIRGSELVGVLNNYGSKQSKL